MKRHLLLILALASALFAAPGHAIDFSELPLWDADTFYRRGDVVRVDHDMYISVVPNRGRVPQAHWPFWRRVDYTEQRSFRPKSLYFIGKVVSHDGKFYISRRINVPLSSSSFEREGRWLEFTHPGLLYDIPDMDGDPDEVDTLIGVDSNTNGIRDDYETEIIFSDLPDPVKRAALSAGKAYGALMDTASAEVEVDEAQARAVLRNLVLAQVCKVEMQALHQGATWQEASYFNTLDRIESKFKLQNMLARVTGGQRLVEAATEACTALSAI